MDDLKALFDPLYFVMHIANFIVLAFVLRKLLYKPVKKLMDKRRELVAEEQKKLMEADADIARKRQELDESMEAGYESLHAEQVAAMTDISKKADNILQKAQQEAEQILETGRANVEREQQAAVANMDVLIAELAVDIAGKLISTQLSKQEQLKLIEESIEEAKRLEK